MKKISECYIKTFAEIFIQQINKLIINRQLYDDVFIKFRKNNEIIYILN